LEGAYRDAPVEKPSGKGTHRFKARGKIIMKKETIQLTYELCVQQMERWQALGRNYTAAKKWSSQKGGPKSVVFHLLDLDTVDTGIRITVPVYSEWLMVEFPPFGGRYSNRCSYPSDAVPVQPFRNEERIKAWKEFIDAMQTPRQQEREIVIQ
jgi:hypothetical protein